MCRKTKQLQFADGLLVLLAAQFGADVRFAVHHRDAILRDGVLDLGRGKSERRQTAVGRDLALLVDRGGEVRVNGDDVAVATVGDFVEANLPAVLLCGKLCKQKWNQTEKKRE